MKIIHFPGGAPHVDATINSDPNLRLAVGPMAFSCTICGETTSANFTNMVFRSLEFYCLSCGSPHRVTNPAFAARRK